MQVWALHRALPDPVCKLQLAWLRTACCSLLLACVDLTCVAVKGSNQRGDPGAAELWGEGRKPAGCRLPRQR